MTQSGDFKLNAKELPYTAYLKHEKMSKRADRELVVCRRKNIQFVRHGALWHYKHGRTKVTLSFDSFSPSYNWFYPRDSKRVPTSKVECDSCETEFGPGKIFPG